MVDLVLDLVQADTLAQDLARAYAKKRAVGYPVPPQFYGAGKQPVPPSSVYLRYYVRPAGGTLHVPSEAAELDLTPFPFAIQKALNPVANLGSVLGINVSGEITVEAIDAAVELGITWIRFDWSWAAMHATEAAYNADVAAGGVWPGMLALQGRIAYAHSQQIKLLAVAIDAPAWARGANRTDGGTPARQAVLPSKRTQFAEFARQLALCSADAIEVRNEPNFTAGGGYSFGPDHPRAAFPSERVDDYVLLMKAVYSRIKGDVLTAACQVGLGGIATLGHDQIADPAFIHSLAWYTKMFASTADDRVTPVSVFGSFDFANIHTYADARTQAGPLAWDARWIDQPNDAIYWHGIANVWRIRQLLIAQGCGDKQIWSTEAGAPTAGTGFPISEALQATWVTEYCTAWFTNGPSGFSAPLSTTFFGNWTGPMIFFSWHDVSNGVIAPTTTEGFFGVARYDLSHKPSWDALKTAAATKFTTLISRWWTWLQSKTTYRNVREGSA